MRSSSASAFSSPASAAAKAPLHRRRIDRRQRLARDRLDVDRLDRLQRCADGRLDLLGILAGAADFDGVGVDFAHCLGRFRPAPRPGPGAFLPCRSSPRPSLRGLRAGSRLDRCGSNLCRACGDRAAHLRLLGRREVAPPLGLAVDRDPVVADRSTARRPASTGCDRRRRGHCRCSRDRQRRDRHASQAPLRRSGTGIST